MVKIPKKVTAKMLKRRGACKEQVRKFSEVFGDEVEVTIENAKKAIKAKLDMYWFCWSFNIAYNNEFQDEKDRILQRQSHKNADIAYGKALIWLLKQQGRS